MKLNTDRSSKERDEGVVDFEKAIALTGFGKFHYMFIFICGAIFFSAGIQNGLNGYIMPSAQCDLKMNASQMGLLNAVFLLGATASAFFWGILADQFGRKYIMVVSLLTDGTLTFFSSFSPTYPLFAAFRFINGFVVGAPSILVFPYLGEFLAEKQRATCLCITGFFWAISWLVLPAVALVLIPREWSFEILGLVFNTWRMYVAISAFPALITSIVLWIYFPESPKFLFSQRRLPETLAVLQKMHRMNYGKDADEYPVKSILSDEIEFNDMNKQNTDKSSSSDNGKSLFRMLQIVWGQIQILFSTAFIGKSILGSMLQFTNLFTYYGLGLWLPEIFNRFEDHYSSSNLSVTVCELTRLRTEMKLNLTIVSGNETDPINYGEDFCGSNGVNSSVFLNTFIISACYLVGNVLIALAAQKISLKALEVSTMLIAGVCATAIYFLRTATQNLVMSCLFLTFAGCANTVICSVVTELFPTRIRAVAICLAIFLGRLGSVLSNLTVGYILDISCEVPIFLMGAVITFGGLLGLLLPTSSKKEPD